MARYTYMGQAVPDFVPVAFWEGVMDARLLHWRLPFSQLYRHGLINRALYRLGWMVAR